MNWFLFSIFISLATALMTSVAWGKVPSDVVAKAQANLCALPASQLTEAQTCVDCEKASSSAAVAIPKAIPIATNTITDLEKTRMRRDLEFLKWHAVKYTAESLTCTLTIESCEISVQKLMSSNKDYQLKVIEDEKKLAAFEKSLTELSELENGKALSNESAEVVRKLVEDSLKFGRLKENPFDTQESIQKWSLGSLGKMPQDLAQFENFKKLLKDSIGYANDNVIYGRKEIHLLDDALKEYQQKLSVLKEADKALPTEELERLQTELNRLEAIFSKHTLIFMNQNPGYRDCGLSASERLAIITYTGQDYFRINRAIRTGGTEGEEYRIFRTVMDAGLEKLGNYQGEVQRGTTLPSAVLAEYQVGNIVTMPAYTSASLGDGFDGVHRFILKSRDGHYIAPFSNHYQEHEVIFKPGAKFKILSRQNKPESIDFVLDEIESESAPQESAK